MMSKNNKNKKQQRQFEDDEDMNLDCYDPQEEMDLDPEYQKMVGQPKKKANANSYFLNSQKYQGRADVMQEEESQMKQSEDQGVNQFEDEIKNALGKIKTERNKKSKLLEQDLKAIDNEDRQNLIEIKKFSGESGNSEALKHQLSQFSKLVEIRYLSQKNLQQIKKYPTKHFPQSQQLAHLQQESEKVVCSEISYLLKNYEILAIKTFFSNNQKQEEGKSGENVESSLISQFNSSQVEDSWKKFEEESQKINEKLQAEIISWSQRTTLLKNSSQNKAHYNSLLMQTPIGQTEKVIKDWERASKKCQQKRSSFKILFEKQENLMETHDAEIYDDLDLMQEVQKIYEQDVEKGDKDFVMENTMKYLERKNNSENKSRKQVDRKASKNRKIRFNVHSKMLNFMPCQIENLLEARNEIVSNLFSRGGHKGKGQEEGEYIDM